jgi:hypothetical protein
LSAKPEESLLWFSLPILEHIEQHRRAGEATMGPQGTRAMHDRLRHAVMALIEDDVRAALGRSGRMAGHASPDLLVEWIASSFVLVLNWWWRATARCQRARRTVCSADSSDHRSPSALAN